MELVHLKNCNNCSISFLREKLVIENTKEVCPICLERDDEELLLVYVGRYTQLEPSLIPYVNHYRCLCCGNTFINVYAPCVMFPVRAISKPNTNQNFSSFLQ